MTGPDLGKYRQHAAEEKELRQQGRAQSTQTLPTANHHLFCRLISLILQAPK